MNSTTNQIVRDFIQAHNLSTVILYGSYARGDFSEASDLDLLGIKADTENYTDTRIIHGIRLDGWITSPKTLSDLDHYLKLLGGVVVKDENDVGLNLLKRVQNYYEQGPKPITDNEREHIIAWVNKMLSRAEVKDIEGNYRRNWLLNDLLEYYFKLRNKWYLGPKRAFQLLKEKDPKAFALYEKCLKDPTDLDLLNKLSELCLAKPPVVSTSH